MRGISIVIPNYNGKHLLERFVVLRHGSVSDEAIIFKFRQARGETSR